MADRPPPKHRLFSSGACRVCSTGISSVPYIRLETCTDKTIETIAEYNKRYPNHAYHLLEMEITVSANGNTECCVTPLNVPAFCINNDTVVDALIVARRNLQGLLTEIVASSGSSSFFFRKKFPKKLTDVLRWVREEKKSAAEMMKNATDPEDIKVIKSIPFLCYIPVRYDPKIDRGIPIPDLSNCKPYSWDNYTDEEKLEIEMAAQAELEKWRKLSALDVLVDFIAGTKAPLFKVDFHK